MMEFGIEAVAVILNFTKVFDSVSPQTLIEKLQAIGLDVYLVGLLTTSQTILSML